MSTPRVFVVALFAVGLAALSADARARSAELATPAADGSAKPPSWRARGVLESIDDGGRSVMIRHEAIPGFMRAMTMSFDVPRRELLGDLAKGDAVTFSFHETADGFELETIARASSPPK